MQLVYVVPIIEQCWSDKILITNEETEAEKHTEFKAAPWESPLPDSGLFCCHSPLFCRGGHGRAPDDINQLLNLSLLSCYFFF